MANLPQGSSSAELRGPGTERPNSAHVIPSAARNPYSAEAPSAIRIPRRFAARNELADSRLPHGDVSRSRVQIEHGAPAAHLAANLAAIVGSAFLRNRRVNRNAAGAGARVNIETGLRSHPQVHAARSSLDSPGSRR